MGRAVVSPCFFYLLLGHLEQVTQHLSAPISFLNKGHHLPKLLPCKGGSRLVWIFA